MKCLFEHYCLCVCVCVLEPVNHIIQKIMKTQQHIQSYQVKLYWNVLVKQTVKLKTVT